MSKRFALMIDPPSGWRYGFPKEYPGTIDTDEELKTWLLAEGYPLHLMDQAVNYSRYWTTEVDEDDRRV